MIKEIALPQNIFLDRNLTDLNLKNFIFGKNATGKSTITSRIESQYSNTYDIRIFQGFDRIVQENGGLTAIALGRENAELQPEIDQKKQLIAKIKEEIDQPESGLKQKFEKSMHEYSKLNDEIEKFFTSKASEIKNYHTDWTGPNYDKRNFKNDINDINQQSFLTNEEIVKNKKIIKEDVLNNQQNKPFKVPEIHNYLTAVNDIISEDVSKTAVLKFKSIEEENWVKQGLSLHSKNDVCAFCGSRISSTRWDDLNGYFNNEVKTLENRLNKASNKITSLINNIENISTVNKSDFYLKFQSEIDDLNIKINEAKSTYKKFLSILLNSIKKRQENIFNQLPLIELPVPSEFSDLLKSYYILLEKNKAYSKNLEKEKQKAKNKLRLNEVAIELNNFNYFEKKGQLSELQKNSQQAELELNKKNEELDNAIIELKTLFLKTKDETIAAENINKQLSKLGNQSFTLQKAENEESNGQYWVIGNDGNRRDISTLSTGEKNIVAFLWFMNDLENPEKRSDNEMIIVFDDPMNSNDDTVQYLIISKLQQLLRDTKKEDRRQIFILTHNTHFYSNVRYDTWWKGETQGSTKRTFHLEKCGKKTKIRSIENKHDDIKTSYDELWEEVRFLYEDKKPNFMLNPLRRILETYQEFNRISKDKMYADDFEAKKLFNVNSHCIDDFETDLNGKNEEAIMNIVEGIFKKLNATEHFDHYWKSKMTDN